VYYVLINILYQLIIISQITMIWSNPVNGVGISLVLVSWKFIFTKRRAWHAKVDPGFWTGFIREVCGTRNISAFAGHYSRRHR